MAKAWDRFMQFELVIVIVIRNGCFKGSDQIRRIPSVQSKMHHENMSMQ